jgi:hypothetical protein
VIYFSSKAKNQKQIGPHVFKIFLFIDLQLLSHRFKTFHVHQLVVVLCLQFMLYNQLPIKILLVVPFAFLHPSCLYKESKFRYQQFLFPFNKGTYFAPHLHNLPIFSQNRFNAWKLRCSHILNEQFNSYCFFLMIFSLGKIQILVWFPSHK